MVTAHHRDGRFPLVAVRLLLSPVIDSMRCFSTTGKGVKRGGKSSASGRSPVRAARSRWRGKQYMGNFPPTGQQKATHTRQGEEVSETTWSTV